jgi:hypothetical protein
MIKSRLGWYIKSHSRRKAGSVGYGANRQGLCGKKKGGGSSTLQTPTPYSQLWGLLSCHLGHVTPSNEIVPFCTDRAYSQHETFQFSITTWPLHIWLWYHAWYTLLHFYHWSTFPVILARKWWLKCMLKHWNSLSIWPWLKSRAKVNILDYVSESQRQESCCFVLYVHITAVVIRKWLTLQRRHLNATFVSGLQ